MKPSKIQLNTRECLEALSTNSNNFKAFRDKYSIQSSESIANQEKYDLKQVVKYWVEDAVERKQSKLNKDEEDARHKAAQATLKEMEIKVKQGELLNREEVEQEVSEILVMLKTKLLGLPDIITNLVFGVEDKSKVKVIVKKKVYETLDELSRLETLEVTSNESPS